MKFALFDSILESHVVRSLARALRARGHEVLVTGQLAHTHSFISAPSDIQRVRGAIDDVVDFRPDATLVFRPASLPVALLSRLRRAGGHLFAWFSDDPVLWKLCYGPVLDFYDTILHCGGVRVLEFYERLHGRPTGVNFPFWSDGVEFPHVYGSKAPESDVVFLGNVNDKIRRKRYYQLGLLGLDLRIHGQVGDDYLNVSGGYLDTQEEVLEAGSRSRLAINIPQLFADHRGAPTWFDGLDKLGSFQIPSRVVQCAAMGLPIVSLMPSGETLDAFPEAKLVHDAENLRVVCADLLSSGELPELGRRTRRRFELDFSAASRVLALEQLLVDDGWRRLGALERADWFRGFSSAGQEGSEDQAADSPASCRESMQLSSIDESREAVINEHLAVGWESLPRKKIAVLGRGRGDHFSALRTATRALRSAGHDVVDVLPQDLEGCLSPDPFGGFSAIVDLDKLHDRLSGVIDCYVLVGAVFLPAPAATIRLRDRADVLVVVHQIEATGYSESLGRLAAQADAISVLHESAREALLDWGIENVIVLPDLVDRDFLRILRMQGNRQQRAVIVADDRRQLARNSDLIGGLGAMEVSTYVADEVRGQPHGLAKVARLANSTLSIVLTDDSRPGHPLNRLFGHFLLGGGLVVVARTPASRTPAGQARAWIVAAEGRELQRKLGRLVADPSAARQVRCSALGVGLANFSAEEALERLLEQAESKPRIDDDNSAMSSDSRQT
ncbi:hypothetical protein ACQ3I4_04230 [Zafaria sp. Z1313]|uniref:hypothetical protein n=1 Tax=Zafaria sp. Z1313 TaxID=3423202 RepID=UPI003D302509